MRLHKRVVPCGARVGLVIVVSAVVIGGCKKKDDQDRPKPSAKVDTRVTAPEPDAPPPPSRIEMGVCYPGFASARIRGHGGGLESGQPGLGQLSEIGGAPGMIGPDLGTDGPSLGPGRTPGRRPVARPRVTMAQPQVQGDMEKEVVRRYLRRNLPRARRCYEGVAKADPSVVGTMKVRLVISAAGKVIDAKATGLTTKLSSCVAAAIRAIRFSKPAGGGIVVVKVDYRFQPPERYGGNGRRSRYRNKQLPKRRMRPRSQSREVKAKAAEKLEAARVRVAAVEAQLRGDLKQVKACWNNAPERKDAYAQMLLELEVDDKGAVVNAAASGYASRPVALESCLADAVKTMTFPAGTGTQRLSCGFAFGRVNRDQTLAGARRVKLDGADVWLDGAKLAGKKAFATKLNAAADDETPVVPKPKPVKKPAPDDLFKAPDPIAGVAVVQASPTASMDSIEFYLRSLVRAGLAHLVFDTGSGMVGVPVLPHANPPRRANALWVTMYLGDDGSVTLADSNGWKKAAGGALRPVLAEIKKRPAWERRTDIEIAAGRNVKLSALVAAFEAAAAEGFTEARFVTRAQRSVNVDRK